MDRDRKIDLDYVNKRIRRDPEGYIRRCEAAYIDQVVSVCQLVKENGSKIVLLAGPSSSGKTTTAHNITTEFGRLGITADCISLDDFYRDRKDLPVLPDGSQDLETVDALDVPYLHHCFEELLTRGHADFPIFDFTTGCRSDQTRRIVYGNGHILILEGIHALNPSLSQRYNDNTFFKTFISIASEYTTNSGKRVLLDRHELRLIRRMVRDLGHRNASVEDTMSMWKSVRKGERLYITPYKDSADYKINSILDYEPGIFQPILMPLLKTVDPNSHYYKWLHYLYDVLCHFQPLPLDKLPEQSLLHEFVS